MVDANVWVSLVARPRSSVARWWSQVSPAKRVFLSPTIRDEVLEVLARRKMRPYGTEEALTDRAIALFSSALLLAPPPLPAPVCRDPDDDHVLALALHAEAGWIVTGDRDLLVLDPWEGVRIVAPGDVE